MSLDSLLMMVEHELISKDQNDIERTWPAGGKHMPSFPVTMMLFTPLLVTLLFPEISGYTVCGAWLASVLCLLVVNLVNSPATVLLEILQYATISGLLLYINYHKNCTALCLQDEIEKNSKECLDKMNGRESAMKILLGNMAHDLKTPLSSLMAGLDVMANELGECQHKLAHHMLDFASVQELIRTSHTCLTNMKHTNEFMLMAINRCIDYTKADKGVKLVPKFETIDLLETLSLPLHCMKGIQDRVNIQLLPIPKEICSHVITDKQWLQENVLCLLSNAAKYSNGGETTVRVSLQPCLDLEEKISPPSPTKLSPKSPRPSKVSRRLSSVAPTLNRDSTSSLVNASRIFSEVLVIEIEDTGIGMSEETMSTLFSPFKQAQLLAGGTGLGLFSLSQRIDALKGKCGVTKRRDGRQGSLFWFSVPYRPDVNRSNVQLAVADDVFGKGHTYAAPYTVGLGSVSSSAPAYFNPTLSTSTGTVPYQGRRSSLSLVNEHYIDDHSVDILSVTENINYRDIDKLFNTMEGPLHALMADHDGDIENQLGSVTKSARLGGLLSANNNQFEHTSNRRLQILLVDDSPAILKMTSMMLRKQGFDVDLAENGAVALQIIERRLEPLQSYLHSVFDQQGSATNSLNITQSVTSKETIISLDEKFSTGFDLILTDLQMPILDGLELAKRLRELENSINQSIVEIVDSKEELVHHVLIGLSANSDDETIA